jgi:hypothetical protein
MSEHVPHEPYESDATLCAVLAAAIAAYIADDAREENAREGWTSRAPGDVTDFGPWPVGQMRWEEAERPV